LSDIEINELNAPETLFKVVNPVMKFTLNSPLHGLLDSDLLLLRWEGRRTGKAYTTPVGYHQNGDNLTVFTSSSWKANFKEPYPVEVKLKGEWHSGTAVIQDDPRATAEYIKQSVDEGGSYARFRMRVEGDRELTIEELMQEVDRRDMVLIKIDLEG
jgi:hypothetical protein